jgi:hypothetical protein
LGGNLGPRADRRPAPTNAIHAAEARFVREHDAQASPAPGGRPPRFPHRIRKAVFFKSILRRQVALAFIVLTIVVVATK